MGHMDKMPLHAMRLKRDFLSHQTLKQHPAAEALVKVATGGSHLSSSGYPYIVEDSFCLFVKKVPHLFRDGLAILDWTDALDLVIESRDDLDEYEIESLNRTRKVLRNMVNTAGITAPSDLWLLRQVLDAHLELGLLLPLMGDAHTIEAFADQYELDPEQLERDWHLLASRGYLNFENGTYVASEAGRQLFTKVTPLKPEWRDAMIRKWVGWFSGVTEQGELLEDWLKLHSKPESTRCWIANYHQVEVGYRLLPVVLGLRAARLTKHLKEGMNFTEVVEFRPKGLETLLYEAGLLDKSHHITKLGARVFERGPGPFGIIGAYDAYMLRLTDLLKGEKVDSWVSRGENVAASQDANRKTFEAGNRALDKFCKDYHYKYNVFIEHAVGKGEATRQRFLAEGEDHIQYFGADLEDAAIDEAIKQKDAGVLPKNMRFIRGADIGVPARVTEKLNEWKVPTDGAVMMVGNGFHEVRNQTNDKMVEVFSGYQEAGIFLIFTEETGLSDEDLIHTAWNTYHAGFRYVHEISGQGLRPANDATSGRWSWPQCARKAGYVVHPSLTSRTRTIYPFRKGRNNNPSISMTYFCIPEKFAKQLGVLDEISETTR